VPGEDPEDSRDPFRSAHFIDRIGAEGVDESIVAVSPKAVDMSAIVPLSVCMDALR